MTAVPAQGLLTWGREAGSGLGWAFPLLPLGLAVLAGSLSMGWWAEPVLPVFGKPQVGSERQPEGRH